MTALLDSRAITLLTALVALVACTPVLDWRQVRVGGGSLLGLYLCRPEHRVRTVPLAAANRRMEMVACMAGDSTYAISYVDLVDPATVTGALEALRTAAATNVGGIRPRIDPFFLRGMTPNVEATRLRVEGRLPDGKAVQENAVFFVRGLRIYQASVIGAIPAPEAVETFLAGLKLAP